MEKKKKPCYIKRVKKKKQNYYVKNTIICPNSKYHQISVETFISEDPKLDKLLKDFCEAIGTSPHFLAYNTEALKLISARQYFIWLGVTQTNASFQHIASKVGRDRSLVYHSCNVIENHIGQTWKDKKTKMINKLHKLYNEYISRTTGDTTGETARIGNIE